MVTIKDIEAKTMSPEKRQEAKKDLFAFYVGRPLSYLLTIPFINTSITPNQVSYLSLLPLGLGLGLMLLVPSLAGQVLAWLCFFLWNLLDGVDGNLARYKGISSPMGSVVDAMSGYAAMFISYLAMGVAASYRSALSIWKPEWLLVLGALSGAFVIFPRLVMHKAINTVQTQESQQLKGRKNFGLAEVIALNLTSISGMPQVFMLIAILLGWNDLFTVGYFLLNGLVMILSLRKVLR